MRRRRASSGAAWAQRQVAGTAARRRRRGDYADGLEDRLDAHGRALVAARGGPWRDADRPPAAVSGTGIVTVDDDVGPGDDVGSSGVHSPPLRLLFVLQRYGTEVAGGAERHCREFATRLAARGHRVEVLTSRAVSAEDWANEYPAGESELDGVQVHRLGVEQPRDGDAFEAATVAVLWSGQRVSLDEQAAWRRLQGPTLPDLVPWLRRRASGFDVVVHFSYLFATTWEGLGTSAAVSTTVLHATAHDEPAFWLPVYDDLFGRPTQYAWSTEEERDLLLCRGAPARGAVVGVGTDL
ncbi:MAG TPA: glycosyltransferase, partial [Acidimicrobiales bacterium]|nr:glycosyltransferase [Acidimicrobiales bacterium]